MSRKSLFLMAVIASISAGLLFGKPEQRPVSAPDLSGFYTSGQSDVRISKNGAVYQIRWDAADGRRWIGVGVVDDDLFSVAWDFPHGGNLGVATYRITEGAEGPRLVGRWASYYDNRSTDDELVFAGK